MQQMSHLYLQVVQIMKEQNKFQCTNEWFLSYVPGTRPFTKKSNHKMTKVHQTPSSKCSSQRQPRDSQR